MAKKKTTAPQPKAEENTNEKAPPLAESLIGLALKVGQDQELTLGELIGHMECAKIDVYTRVTAQARAAEQQAPSAPSEGGDTQELEVVS
jgi:hypothetical protein